MQQNQTEKDLQGIFQTGEFVMALFKQHCKKRYYKDVIGNFRKFLLEFSESMLTNVEPEVLDLCAVYNYSFQDDQQEHFNNISFEYKFKMVVDDKIKFLAQYFFIFFQLFLQFQLKTERKIPSIKAFFQENILSYSNKPLYEPNKIVILQESDTTKVLGVGKVEKVSVSLIIQGEFFLLTKSSSENIENEKQVLMVCYYTELTYLAQKKQILI